MGMEPVISLDKRGRVFVAGWDEDRACSNGAGKSSIINAIKEIAFGKNDTGKSGSNVVNKHCDWDNGMYGVLWCVCRNNRMWRISNIRKWKGDPPNGVYGPSEVKNVGGTYTGTDIFVEEWDGQIWLDKRPTATKDNKNLRDAQQFIVREIFGMTYDQFSAYVCLGQKAESALVIGTSGAREKIIQSITDVSVWTSAADIVKITYNNKEMELNNVQQKIYGMQSTLDTLQPPSEFELQEAARSIKIVEDNHHNNQQALVDVNKTIWKLESKIDGKNAGIDQEIDLLSAEERHSRERFAAFRVSDPPIQINDLTQDITRITTLNRSDLDKHDHYKRLGVGECGHCGQKVTKKHLEKEIQKFVDAMAERGTQTNVLQGERNKLQSEYDKKCEVDRADVAKKMEGELAAIDTSKQKLFERKQSYDAAVADVVHVQENKQHLEIEMGQYNINIATAKANLASLQKRIQDLDCIKTGINSEQIAAKSIDDEIKHLKWTERNLKKLRIQEYETALGRLNQIIAERLYELWGPGLLARFITARTTTRGQSTVAQLDFIVDTPKKVGIPIEMYSGGERKIIIISTFLAMIQLSNERGLGVNIAGVDELDENLDDVNTDKLVEAFEAISNVVQTCLVISHNSRLLNTMTFDETWTVYKKNEFSTVVIGEVDRIVA